MFEDFKAGNIGKRLLKLSRYSEEFKNEKYNKSIIEYLPNCIQSEGSYTYIFLNYDEKVISYEFTIDNITYGFEEPRGYESFIYIKVQDIVIYHNRNEHSCQGLFEGVKSGWNHNSPKEMLEVIKSHSVIIDDYIRNIKQYLKSGDNKHDQEQQRLKEIFCKE